MIGQARFVLLRPQSATSARSISDSAAHRAATEPVAADQAQPCWRLLS